MLISLRDQTCAHCSISTNDEHVEKENWIIVLGTVLQVGKKNYAGFDLKCVSGTKPLFFCGLACFSAHLQTGEPFPESRTAKLGSANTSAWVSPWTFDLKV